MADIINLTSPKVDFSHTIVGLLTFTWIWKTDFDYYEATMPNLLAKVTFPFAINHSEITIQVKWIKVTDTCIISTNLKTAVVAKSNFSLWPKKNSDRWTE